jgi:hypothetical protein
MPRDYAALAVGDTISDRTFQLGLDGVEKYTAAVWDESGVFDPSDESPTVPPMAVATFALRGVLDDLGIPEGTLHVGQEMAFLGAVPTGEELSCRALISQNAVKTGFRLLAVGMDVRDRNDKQVMTAKSTILVPA